MNARVKTAIFLLITTLSTTAAAQKKPDFAGTWTTPPELVANIPVPEPGKTGIAAKRTAALRITQKDGLFTVSGTSLTDTFALDGSETRNCVKYSSGCVYSKCHARWDAEVLVLSCRHPIGTGGDTEMLTTQKLSIDADGNLRTEDRMLGPGFNAVLRGTYVRRANILFDLGVGSTSELDSVTGVHPVAMQRFQPIGVTHYTVAGGSIRNAGMFVTGTDAPSGKKRVWTTVLGGLAGSAFGAALGYQAGDGSTTCASTCVRKPNDVVWGALLGLAVGAFIGYGIGGGE